jgi:hypothetical protein
LGSCVVIAPANADLVLLASGVWWRRKRNLKADQRGKQTIERASALFSLE